MRLLSLLLLTGCGGPIGEIATEVEPLRHDVQLEVRDGVAKLTVHRAFRGVDGELDLGIPLPSGGAVDRFRFAFEDRWYAGELLDAELAAERYQLLSGLAGEEGHAIDGAPPPALLAFETDGELRLTAHPLRPEDTVEIEYRIVVPTCHADGVAMLDYPNDPADPPSFSGPGRIREPVEEEDFEARCDPEVTVLDSERVVIELDPLPVGEPALAYGAQPMGRRSAVRVAVDLPAELAPLPEAPSVVFVVDGSYSKADEDLADQLAWARAYLQWVPDAEVEVVVFRRFAERLFGRFVPARELEAELSAVPAERRALGNGSFLDRGVELASSILRGARGETRIVVTSDLLLRSAFDAAAVTADHLTHLLERDASEAAASLTPEAEGELAPIAHATGGIFGTLSGSADTAVAEELVRPIRLDAIELVGLEEVTHDGAIDRGDRLRVTALLEGGAPDRIEVRGRLWSAEVQYRLERSTEVDGAMPSILVASVKSLSDEELAYVARAGGVVSPLTSYLAERGGADPVESPVEVGHIFGIGGIGTGWRCGCCGGISGLGVRHHDGWLEQQIRELAEACGAPDAEVTVETTRDEIADVDVRAADGGECLVEGIWTLRLSEGFRHRTRATLTLSL